MKRPTVTVPYTPQEITPLPRLAHPVADWIAQAVIKNRDLTEDQRKCLGDFTRAVREIVESFDEHQDERKKSELIRALAVGCVSIATATTIGWLVHFEESRKDANIGADLLLKQLDRLRGGLDHLRDHLREGLDQQEAALKVAVIGALRRVRAMQTAKGRAKRSAKTQAGRDLVNKCLDSLFKKKPDWLNGAGITDNRIKDEILPDIEKELKARGLRLLSASTIRNYVKDYRNPNKPA